MYTFDENELVDILKRLTPSARVAFAAAAATRQIESLGHMFPDLRNESADSPPNVLACLWEDLNVASPNVDLWSLRLEAVMNAIPEENDDWTITDALLDDGLSSLAYAIRSMIAGDAQEAVWAARRSYEATDQVVIRMLDVQPGSPAIERTIVEHEVVQRELSRQNQDLRLLSEGRIDEVRRLAHMNPAFGVEEVSGLL